MAAAPSFFAEGYVLALCEPGARGENQARVELLSDGSCSLSAGGCASCACKQGGGCGRLFMPHVEGKRAVPALLVENAIAARPGDRVVLCASRGIRLSASALLFLLPLLVFFAGYALGVALFGARDIPSFGAASLAVILYYLLYHHWEKRRTKKNAPLVWIERVIEE